MKGPFTFHGIPGAWFAERMNFFSADRFLKPIDENVFRACNWSKKELHCLTRILEYGGNQLDFLLRFENDALVRTVIEKMATTLDVNLWHIISPFPARQVLGVLIGSLYWYPRFASLFIKAGARARPTEIRSVIGIWSINFANDNTFSCLIEEIAKAELLCVRRHADLVSNLPEWQQSIFRLYHLRQKLAAKSIIALYATLTRQRLTNRDVARLIAQELWKHRYDSKWN